MQLLDLPVELVQDILRHAIQVRGLKRGIRLRLVNKFFAKEVINVLHVFEMLDTCFESCSDRPVTKLPTFATTYLERRVLNEPDSGRPTLRLIHNVARKLHQADLNGRSVHDYIHHLCEVISHNDEPATRVAGVWEAGQVIRTSNVDTHVYVAAYFTKTTPLVEEWTANGNHPSKTSWVFGSVHAHAAKYGNTDLLAAMMTGSDQFREANQGRRVSMLAAVAEAGRLDAVRFCFNFDSDRLPWEFSRKKRPRHAYQNEWLLASMHTPNRQVFEYLMEKRRLHCIGRDFGAKEYSEFLRHCAIEGWAEMAEHYLDLGASVEGVGALVRQDMDLRPLVEACRHGHGDVIKVLLDHGADTSAPVLELAAQRGDLDIVQLLLERGAEHGSAISLAAAKGYKNVVKELLDHGASVEGSSRSLLAHAIEHEYGKLFALLVERGCDLREQDTAKECVKTAQENGLESMLELLKEHGVDLNNRTTS